MILTSTPRNSKTRVPQETVNSLAEYAIANPTMSITRVFGAFGLSNSTPSTWLYRQPSRRLAYWLAQGDNLERWQQARPAQSIGSGLGELILEHQIANESAIAEQTVAEPPQTPANPGDLRIAIAEIHADARGVVTHTQQLLDALDLINAWTNSTDALTAKQADIQRLTDRLRLADKEIDELKRAAVERNLAVHSRD